MQIGRQSGLKFVRHKQGETAGGASPAKIVFTLLNGCGKLCFFTENIHNGAVIDNFYGKCGRACVLFEKMFYLSGVKYHSGLIAKTNKYKSLIFIKI